MTGLERSEWLQLSELERERAGVVVIVVQVLSEVLTLLCSMAEMHSFFNMLEKRALEEHWTKRKMDSDIVLRLEESGIVSSSDSTNALCSALEPWFNAC